MNVLKIKPNKMSSSHLIGVFDDESGTGEGGGGDQGKEPAD